jgi:hypothetical protein
MAGCWRGLSISLHSGSGDAVAAMLGYPIRLLRLSSP